MMKGLFQGIITIALFLAVWFALSRIDWLSCFNLSQASDKTEEELGELFWDIFRRSEKEYKHPFVINTVDTLLTTICKTNDIDRSEIKLHLLEKDEVNAFALPDGHLVVFTGLISASKSQEELCGVVAHELAHISERHVMQKLVNEVGLSVLLTTLTSGRGSETVANAAKTLSSTAFDRGLEREADMKAVDYLVQAHIDPEPFADFLFRLSEEKEDTENYWSWLSTHPDSKERSTYIIEYCKSRRGTYACAVSDSSWIRLKELLAE